MTIWTSCYHAPSGDLVWISVICWFQVLDHRLNILPDAHLDTIKQHDLFINNNNNIIIIIFLLHSRGVWWCVVLIHNNDSLLISQAFIKVLLLCTIGTNQLNIAVVKSHLTLPNHCLLSVVSNINIAFFSLFYILILLLLNN